MSKSLQLMTERLLLSEITEKDTTLIVKWRSNPEVYQYFSAPHPLKVEEHLDWFRNKYCSDENCLFWMAMEKENRQKIGVFGIKRGEDSLSSAEVSYILSPECQGRGYAREAVERIIKYAKEKWGCSLASAKVHIANQPSIKFAENLGFVPAGRSEDFILYLKHSI